MESAGAIPARLSGVALMMQAVPAADMGRAAGGSSPLLFRCREDRQRIELVKRRRRGKGPFQGRRARAPGVIRCTPLLGKGIVKDVNEQDAANAGEVGYQRRDPVPECKLVVIIDIAAHHPREAKEM